MPEVLVLGEKTYMRPDILKLAKACWKEDLQRMLDSIASRAKGRGLSKKEQTEFLWRSIYESAQEARVPGWRQI